MYVLDDSARESVRDLAWEYGFNYLTRPNRGHLKKAGNLRFGYENSAGDFIAIFDADFVPRPDYLLQLMPYTTEEDVAIVQSPQFFDTHKGMNWVQFAAGATQILFYRWVQPARDRSDAAICVGTCAIYRRSALELSGGFAQIGHSEDVHTGVNLMRVGFRVRYVPIVVSKGLCPDTLDQFANQQYRWCTGSMSLLFSRTFHKSPLTRMQRLCFWSGFLYYIDTAINVFVVSIPPILMAVLAPEAVSVNNYLFVFLAVIVRMSIVPVITMGSGIDDRADPYPVDVLVRPRAGSVRRDPWTYRCLASDRREGRNPDGAASASADDDLVHSRAGSDVGLLSMAGAGARLGTTICR